jgi:hypothetical protein
MYSTVKIVERNNKQHVIGFGVEGLSLGVIKYDYSNVEWKTFVTRELAFRKQEKWEHELTMERIRELEEAEKAEAYDPLAVKSLKSRYVALPLVSKLTG